MEIRSRYRCRKRASTSVSPCHFSGSGLIDLHSREKSWASTLVWPVRVLKTGPVTPSQSPMSRSGSTSYESGRAFFRNSTWIVPEPSSRSTNVALPMRRSAVMRPATETGAVRRSASAGSSDSKRSPACRAVWVRR